MRLRLCDLGAHGWGEPWFPHSAVLLRLLTDLEYGDVCVWVFFFVFWFFRHTNTLDDTMISPFCQLLTFGQPFTLPCLFGLFVLLLFCCFAFVLVLFHWHSDGYLDCVLVLCQFNFCSPLSAKMDNVTALIQ